MSGLRVYAGVLMGKYLSNSPIAYTPEGWPVFPYQDSGGVLRYVACGPNGETRYVLPNGQPLGSGGDLAAGAMLGGLVGALVGPAAIVVGAIAGGILFFALRKRKDASA